MRVFNSDEVPDTIISIFPKFLRAISLDKLDQVELSVLLKPVPDKAPIYSSQVKLIFSDPSVELLILAM